MAKILLHRPTGHCIKIPGNTSSCIFSFALLFPFQDFNNIEALWIYKLSTHP